MTVLSSVQRKVLEGVVVEARGVVEAACSARIEALGVTAETAPAGLSETDRQLRRGLRARQRQLGSAAVLVTEAGFEHWHRMLFSRLLADNGLLVDDIAQQPVSMAGVAEYAAELGEADVWEVAARFASAMLPGIFRQDDPILAMRLPVDVRQQLEALLDRLTLEITTAEDTLGWVYQYWQKQRKDEVNASEVKIGGADLAPVTQLFTEDYMVRFLLENSLGAWWAARHPESPLVAGWEFLRRNDEGSPAAGSFAQWPDRVAEVTVMDPCCGSGHFLVAAFGMLWRMRAEEEGLDPAEAQDAVLRDNLFGLELDPRCTQIAMFALAVEAWKQGGLRQLPIPNVACSGIPARAPLEEWTKLAKGDARVGAALTRLHSLFRDADTLGSLIDPVRASEDAGLESVDWHEIAPLLQTALTRETKHQDDPATAVFGEAATGIARAAHYLSRVYTLAATNVPYLTQNKFSRTLSDYAASQFPNENGDLATVFLRRIRQLGGVGFSLASVSPQSWLTLGRYQRMRENLILTSHLHVLARLGAGAFSSITGEVVQPLLAIWSEGATDGATFIAFDMSSLRDQNPRDALSGSRYSVLGQGAQLDHPESRIILSEVPDLPMLAEYADAYAGIQAGDLPRFGRLFWELPAASAGWAHWQGTVESTVPFSGRQQIFQWEDGVGAYYQYLVDRLGVTGTGAWMRGREGWGKRGVTVSQMGDLPCTLYLGDLWDPNCAAVIPKDPQDLPAIWAYCSSGEFSRDVRRIDQSLKVTNKTLVKVPFDRPYWRKVAADTFPEGLPEPSSDDPKQWLFNGGVRSSWFPLQVAVARLLGFRWPDQQPDDLDQWADDDGIVCLPAVGGETPGEQRLRGLLASAYGDAWSPAVLDSLLVDAGGKPGDLEGWLRKVFFKDHCKVFANRPFIWQIWDGTPDGFSALINYHRLDRRLLERLIYSYLGSWWMERQRDEVRREVPGAEARLAAAQQLKQKLEQILIGEPPFDIFVRWKTLAEQPIGWEPDLDDGVRLNIRPFMTAGVLRFNPNIKWNKDRGKNPDGSERLNDLHFARAEKETARREAGR